MLGLVFASLGYGLCALIGLFATLPSWLAILIICTITLIGIILLIMPFFEFATSILYLEAKNDAEKKTERKSVKKA